LDQGAAEGQDGPPAVRGLDGKNSFGFALEGVMHFFQKAMKKFVRFFEADFDPEAGHALHQPLEPGGLGGLC